MPIVRRADCVPLPIVCPVVTVVMLGSWVERCVHSVENVACLWQASQQLQQDTTIGSGTQSDLLMMGIKMPETC